MKYLIFTMSGVGSGHVSAANGLNSYLRDYTSHESKVIRLNDYIPSFEVGNTSFYKSLVKVLPVGRKLAFDISNSEELNAQKLQKVYDIIAKFLSNLKEEILSYDPDFILHTHFSSDLLLGKFIKEKIPNCKQGFVVTDYMANHRLFCGKWSEYIFVPDSKTSDNLSKFRSDTEFVISGFPTDPRFLCENRKLGESLNVLIMLAWNAKIYQNLYLIKIIFDNFANKNDITFDIVCGEDRILKKTIDLLFNHNSKNIQIHGYRDDIYNLMTKSDICIGKPGGATLSESLLSLCPLVVYTHVPGQEKMNLDYIVANNIGWDLPSTKDIVGLINLLLKDKEQLNSKISMIKKIRNPNPSKTIIDKLFS